MAFMDINVKPKESGGKGGLFGKIAGGLAGLAAGAVAVPTGGASLMAIPAAMSAGASVGGLVGNAIDPLKVTNATGVSQLENATKNDLPTQIAILKNAQLQIPQLGLPAPAMEQLHGHITTAIDKLNQFA